MVGASHHLYCHRNSLPTILLGDILTFKMENSILLHITTMALQKHTLALQAVMRIRLIQEIYTKTTYGFSSFVKNAKSIHEQIMDFLVW